MGETTLERPKEERKEEETGALTAAEAIVNDAHDQMQTEVYRAEYTDSTERRADYHNKYELSRTEKALNKIRKFLNITPQNEETGVTIAHDDAIAEKLFQDEQLHTKQEEQDDRERRNAA